MKKITKIISLILVLILCLTLIASCKKDEGNAVNTSELGNVSTNTPNSATSPTPTSNATMPDRGEQHPATKDATYADAIDIIIDSNTVAAISPFVATGLGPASAWTAILLWDRLLISDSEVNKPLPGLATDWQTDDWITFKLKLREGVTFSNGEKFTADDVIYTYNYAKELVGTVAYNGLWQYVESIKKIDDFNIEIKATTVNVDFLFYLQNTYSVIVNKKAMEADPEKGMWVGTGPYIMKEFVANNYWVVERNDNFWGEPAITQKLTFRFIPEITNRATMLRNGETQLVMRVGVQDMEMFEDNPDYTLFARTINNTNPVMFNLLDPICGDYNFRMAVLYAIDKTEHSFAYNGKWAVPCLESGSIWGRYTEFRDMDIPAYPQDIEKAKEYLAKSAYNGETIEIATMSAGQTAASPLFQQMLADVGIKTEIKLLEQATAGEYVGYGKTNMQIYLATVPQLFTTTSFRNLVYPGGAANYVNYNNPIVTDLIDKATVETDYEKRGELWKQIQEIVAEDRPFENLTWYTETIVGVKGIGGFTWPVDAIYNMRYIYWEIEG